MECFSGQSSVNVDVSTMHLSPSFFQEHHPNFVLLAAIEGRSFAHWLAREHVIDHDFLPHSVEAKGNTIGSTFSHLSLQEDSLDSVLVLSNSGNGTKKIAVSQHALTDVGRINVSLEHLEAVSENMLRTLPNQLLHSSFVVALCFTKSPYRAEVWRELLVNKLLVFP